ncbi:MAG: hypothetical protein RJA49_3106 [Actinomycetota bacterium]
MTTYKDRNPDRHSLDTMSAALVERTGRAVEAVGFGPVGYDQAYLDYTVDGTECRAATFGPDWTWTTLLDSAVSAILADGASCVCVGCGEPIYLATYRDTPGFRWEPDYDPHNDPVVYRHHDGYAYRGSHAAAPADEVAS